VDNVLDDSTNVAMLFGIVQGTKLHGTLASARMRRKDTSLSLTLRLSKQQRGNVCIIHKWHRIRGNFFVGKVKRAM
jgi:hypothetical protein